MPGEVSRSYRGPMDKPKPMPEWPEPDIFKAIDEHAERGGRVVFWTCPNGCRDVVDWNHDGGKSVATCRKCGASNNVLSGNGERENRHG